MPYADQEKQLAHRRAWCSKEIRRKSGRTISPRGRLLSAIARARQQPGTEIEIPYANHNTAHVTAWRFRNGFYGPGLDARAQGPLCVLTAKGGIE